MISLVKTVKSDYVRSLIYLPHCYVCRRHLVKCGPVGMRGVGVTTGKMWGKSVGVTVQGLGKLRDAKMRACACGPD